MSDTTTQPQQWPIPGRAIAWMPPDQDAVVSAVVMNEPTLRSGSLTHRQYRSLLADRVAWMVRTADDPEDAAATMVREFEAAGLWTGATLPLDDPDAVVQALTLDNPTWQDALNLVVMLPPEPMPIRLIPAAVQAVRETDLEEWLSRVLPVARDLT